MESAISRNCRRVILRRGEEYVVFRTTDVAYIYLENKCCYLVDQRNGFKNRVSGTLHDIYEMLDHGEFYRVNKNYIVNIRSIISLRCCDVNKVELILKPQPTEKVFISQLRICHFKEWIEMENVVVPE
ncbi:MAG TPA: LytTR family DNA-binding domain-containing protein [Puia sp.]|jgi:DNA-binding LytR/AlgR family response regulator